jgi:hypothetical protein
MGAVSFVAGSQRRRRWRALVLLTVLAGVLGGAATSLVAGASRTASVVDRYSAAQPVVDVQVFGSGVDLAAMLRVPGVVDATVRSYVAMSQVGADGGLRDGVNGFTYDYARPLSRGTTLVAGRFPDGSDPSHVAVNERFVRQFGLGVGDALRVRTYSDDQAEALQHQVYEPAGPTYVFHIDGVVRQQLDIATEQVRSAPAPGGGTPAHQSRAYVLVPYAFLVAHQDEFLDFGEDFDVRLRDGSAGLDAFAAALAQVTRPGVDAGLEPGGNTHRASFDSPVDLEARALLGLGITVGVAGLVVVLLLLILEQRWHESDTERLRGLGLTKARLRAVAVVKVAPAAAVAAVLAAGLAVLASGRYPIGIGRMLELDGGLQVNAVVVLAGSALTAATVIATAALVERPRGERPAPTALRSTVARRLRRWGAPLAPSLGAHVAFESDNGRPSSTARQGVMVATGLLAVTVAAGMWIGGVDEFHDNRPRHGWPWDLIVGNTNFELSADHTSALLGDHRFSAISAASYGQLTVAGDSLEALVVDDSGTAPLPIIRGRAPHGANEIALGRLTLRRRHLVIGAPVVLSLENSEFGSGGTAKVTVVGETLAPVEGESELGDIAVVPASALEVAGGDLRPQLLLANLRPGVDRDATIAALSRDFHEEMTLDIVPARAVNLHRVRGVPLVGGTVGSVVAALALAYTTIAGARRHRRELAVLRAVGLEWSTVRRAIAWQGALLTGIVLGIGLPLGLVAGTKLWTTIADGIGIEHQPATPAWLLIPPIGIALAAGISSAYAGRSRRGALLTALRAG